MAEPHAEGAIGVADGAGQHLGNVAMHLLLQHLASPQPEGLVLRVPEE